MSSGFVGTGAAPLLDGEDRALERGVAAFPREFLHERARAARVGLELQRGRFAVPEWDGRSLGLLAAAGACGSGRARRGSLRARALGAERRRGGGDEREEHELTAVDAGLLLVEVGTCEVGLGLVEEFFGSRHGGSSWSEAGGAGKGRN